MLRIFHIRIVLSVLAQVKKNGACRLHSKEFIGPWWLPLWMKSNLRDSWCRGSSTVATSLLFSPTSSCQVLPSRCMLPRSDFLSSPMSQRPTSVSYAPSNRNIRNRQSFVPSTIILPLAAINFISRCCSPSSSQASPTQLAIESLFRKYTFICLLLSTRATAFAPLSQQCTATGTVLLSYRFSTSLSSQSSSLKSRKCDLPRTVSSLSGPPWHLSSVISVQPPRTLLTFIFDPSSTPITTTSGGLRAIASSDSLRNQKNRIDFPYKLLGQMFQPLLARVKILKKQVYRLELREAILVRPGLTANPSEEPPSSVSWQFAFYSSPLLREIKQAPATQHIFSEPSSLAKKAGLAMFCPQLEPQTCLRNKSGSLFNIMKKDHEDVLNDYVGLDFALYRARPADDLHSTVYSSQPLLPGTPSIQQLKELPQRFFAPKENILNECIKREIEKVCFQDDFERRLVYDSEKQNSERGPREYAGEVPWLVLSGLADTTLVFESRFESGNLRRAIQMGPFEYYLILKPDSNTETQTQWFYFNVANTRKNVEYRLSIVNMVKPDSQYNAGMRPLAYSIQRAAKEGVGWHRVGEQICYFCNVLKKKSGGQFYTLQFKIKFQYNNDSVYLAHSYPYTFTNLLGFYRRIDRRPDARSFCQRKQLCLTTAGNSCDYLLISEFNNGKDKRAIVLTSRVHPGESMTSYIIERVIQFLLSESPIAARLRQNFIFKIIPMLNPDGVIQGNYRSDLLGVDLNRQWIDPNKKQHPTIYAAKALIKKTKDERPVSFVCDFHGHSRKRNVFIYGCPSGKESRQQQVFPFLMKGNCPVFSYKDCSFNLQKDREGTARIALWREMAIAYSYTMEISFSGADFGKYELLHFSRNIFDEIAVGFCSSLLDLFQADLKRISAISDEIRESDDRRQAEPQDSDDSDYEGERL